MKTTVIDVRSPQEFSNGNVSGSLNIPLNEIPSRLEDLQKMEGHLILCCASGNRSGMAVGILKQNGIDNCENGGGWMNVQNQLERTAQ